MIQRVQSLYLLIVAILSVVGLTGPLAAFNKNGNVVAEFSNFVFNKIDKSIELPQPTGSWPLGIILIVVAAISLTTIFFFNNRRLQIRLIIFNIILLIAYAAVFAFFAWIYTNGINEFYNENIEFQMKLAAVYPIVSLILSFLAFKGVRKDEKLVKSLERIRPSRK